MDKQDKKSKEEEFNARRRNLRKSLQQSAQDSNTRAMPAGKKIDKGDKLFLATIKRKGEE